jgi:hypothetical protein
VAREYGRGVEFSFEQREPPSPWGSRQPKFAHLLCDGPDRFYLVYRAPSGEEVRVQLEPAGDGWRRELP